MARKQKSFFMEDSVVMKNISEAKGGVEGKNNQRILPIMKLKGFLRVKDIVNGEEQELLPDCYEIIKSDVTFKRTSKEGRSVLIFVGEQTFHIDDKEFDGLVEEGVIEFVSLEGSLRLN